jgi:hypothetical protein
MSESMVIDDFAACKHLATLCAWARAGQPIPLVRLHTLAHGSASPRDVKVYGRAWLAALISAAERGGVGQLERGEDGVVFKPAADVPAAVEAWSKVQASWDDLEVGQKANQR